MARAHFANEISNVRVRLASVVFATQARRNGYYGSMENLTLMTLNVCLSKTVQTDKKLPISSKQRLESFIDYSEHASLQFTRRNYA